MQAMKCAALALALVSVVACDSAPRVLINGVPVMGTTPDQAFLNTCVSTAIGWTAEPTGATIGEFVRSLKLKPNIQPTWEKSSAATYVLRLKADDALTGQKVDIAFEFVGQSAGSSGPTCANGSGNALIERVSVSEEIVPVAAHHMVLSSFVDFEKLKATPIARPANPPVPEPQGAQILQTAQFMESDWVAEPDWCASGSPLGLRSNGAFSGEGYEGTWRVEGDRLITRERTTYDNEPDKSWHESQAAVRVNGNDEIVLDWGDGATRYRRCVGETEPWNGQLP